MTDHHDPHQTTGDPARPPTLDGDAALDLLLANTGPSQTVVDFDDDPVLRAAARTTGRRYHALSVRLRSRRSPAPHPPDADLVTLAWPRPHSPTPAAAAEALAVAAGLLRPGGHVALLLEPTLPQPYTITWTGAVLTAARDAGLDYLQDVVCLHTHPDPDDRADGDPRHPQHRVVLILRPGNGRYA